MIARNPAKGEACKTHRLKFEQFLAAAVCRVQKWQRVPYSTPHKVDRTFKLEKYSKHDSLAEERWRKADRNRTCENVGGPLPSPPCVRFVRNLCASAATTTENKHNVFHVLSSARKRAHSGAIFSPRLPRFSREPFSYFLSLIPGKITILPVCVAVLPAW